MMNARRRERGKRRGVHLRQVPPARALAHPHLRVAHRALAHPHQPHHRMTRRRVALLEIATESLLIREEAWA